MTFSARKLYEYTIWVLTVFLISSFQIFYQFSWGRYVFLISSALIFLLSAFNNKGRIKLKISFFHIALLLFTAYIFLNSLWSMDAERTVTMGTVLLSILLCYSLLYWAYINIPNNFMFLSTSVVAGSIVIGLYTVIYYGLNNLILAASENRIDNEYTNVNSIAIFLAVGFLVNLYLILVNGFKLWNIVPFLSLFLLAAIQSRKAIIVLVLGALALIIMNTTSKKTALLNRILKIFFIILAFIVGVYLMTKLPFLSGVNNRLDQMFNSFTGNGKADTSSLVRNKLIDIGLTWWAKYPIGGVGIDATREVSRMYLYDDYYMHNNYVEMLCGGGLIGFLLYYSMHAVLMKRFISMRTSARKIYMLGIVILGLILLSDYGRVSYYSKMVYFELMMLFVISESNAVTAEGTLNDRQD